MPSIQMVIGALLTAYVPDDKRALALGFTHVEFSAGPSMEGPMTVLSTVALANGTRDYSYNYTTAAVGEWWTWRLIGSTNGAYMGPWRIGPIVTTRKEIRRAVGASLGDSYRLVRVTSAPTTASFISNDLVDPDASPYIVSSRFMRVSSGSYAGVNRRIRSSTTGYDAITGLVTYNVALGPLSTNDEVELWVPDGESNTADAVDAAINTARQYLWVEDTFYFSPDAGVSEYFLPDDITDYQIRGIEWAATSYPDNPHWRSVPHWECNFQDGQSLLSIPWGYIAGRPVVRVRYNRMMRPLIAENDWWPVDLDWAAAEALCQYLEVRIRPRGGRENTSDALRALQMAESTRNTLRRHYQPAPVYRMRQRR